MMTFAACLLKPTEAPLRIMATSMSFGKKAQLTVTKILLSFGNVTTRIKKWYKLTFSEYQKVYYIAIDGKIIIQANAAILQENHHNDKLCDWLIGKVHDAVERLSTDTDAYHTYVEKNMSFPKRYGKILRSDYWTINDNQKKYFQADFSDDDIKRFKLISEICDAKTAKNRMSRINAGDFFNYCRIGYEANGYFANSKKQRRA